MNSIFRHIAAMPASIGWTGGIGLALLFSACVLGWTLLLPALEESRNLGNELQLLESQSGSASSPAMPVTTLRQQLDEFLSSLPRQDQLNAQLTRLHELAASNHLVLRNGEYRTTTGKDGRIARLQIAVKTEGSYMDLRRFLQELPAELPALSISRFSMRRQTSSDDSLETNVELALYFSRSAS